MNENILNEKNIDVNEPIHKIDIEKNEENNRLPKYKNKIRHLVLSGGGSFGLICYGIL